MRKAINHLAAITVLLLLPMTLMAAGSQADEASAAGSFNATGLPIVNETVTIEVAAAPPAVTTKPLGDFEKVQWLEEMTNVNVEWISLPSGGERAQKVNLMFASGEVPDVLLHGAVNATQRAEFVSEGLLQPLDDLISQYGANIKRVIDLFPTADFAITASDGKKYTTPSVQPWAAEFWVPAFAAGINKEWLDKLGLPIPSDLESFYTTMKAFKEQDPNGNGKADEIPILFFWQSPNSAAHLFHPFGVILETGGWQVENGKVMYAWTHPGMKEAVISLHRLYDEGLINQDAFSITNKEHLSMSRTNPRTVGVFNGWGVVNIMGNDAYLNEEYVHLPSIEGPDGRRHHGARIDVTVGADGAVLSSASKNVEVAFRWLDTIYEEKTNLELSWGPIEWMSDTTFRMMKIPEGQQAAAFRNNGITPKNIWPVDYIAQQYTVVDPPLGVAERTAYGKIIAPFAPKENFPTRLAISTLEEGEIMQQYGTDITEYVQRRIAEFIYKGGAESEWDEYIATVEKMGLARIVEVQQSVYDRFKAGVGGDTSLR